MTLVAMGTVMEALMLQLVQEKGEKEEREESV